MAAQMEMEVQEGREACVGGEITRLAQDKEDSNVNVVSIHSGDSFINYLEGCKNSIKFDFAHKEHKWREADTDEVLLEEVFFEDSVECIIESDTGSSDLDQMSVRVSKWVESRTIVIALPATYMRDWQANVFLMGFHHPVPILIVDKEAWAIYMRDWQAKTRLKRQEARATARLAPRRSPRLSTKCD